MLRDLYERARAYGTRLSERARSTRTLSRVTGFEGGRPGCYARVEGVMGNERVMAVVGLDGSLEGHPSLVRRVAERKPILRAGRVDPLERTLAAVRSVEHVTRLEIVRASQRMGFGALRAVAREERPGTYGDGEVSRRFSLRVSEDNGIAIVSLSGELDLWEEDHVRDEISAIHSGNIVLDLAELTFLDASGLSAILTARRAVTGRGSRFAIRGAQGMVRRVFEVTDLARLLDD